MFKHIPLMILILAVSLTACSPQTPELPTMAPVEIQNTAVSAAFTMVAMTQIALPTATLALPTDTPIPTPMPTFTPEVPMDSIPTLPAPLELPSPTAVSSANLGDCNQILAVAEAGGTVPVRIQNMTDGDVLLSLRLSTNAFGQCGYMPGVPMVGKKTTVTLNLPTGVWSFYGLIDYGKGKSGSSYGSFTVQPSGADAVKIIEK